MPDLDLRPLFALPVGLAARLPVRRHGQGVVSARSRPERAPRTMSAF